MYGKLPLPDSVSNYKGINLLENKEKDQDNFRLYPHIRNQWTTFAYVDVDYNSIDNLISKIEDKDFLNLIEDYHLSLVRGHFILNYHHIKSAIESIRNNTSIYKQFNICLSDLVIFKNENQSKCFLCFIDKTDIKLDLNKFSFYKSLRDTLLQFDIKNSLNSIEEFNFHLSLGWCDIKFENKLIDLIKELDKQIIEPLLIKVKEFKVNIGNQEHKFYLKE